MKEILMLLAVTLLSCNKPQPMEEFNCVVDSVWEEKPISTVQFQSKWYYKTTCGAKLVTQGSQRYVVGDTVTIYRKYTQLQK
jgi:hypothetical protein